MSFNPVESGIFFGTQTVPLPGTNSFCNYYNGYSNRFFGYSTAQRLALNAVNGLLVFDTTLQLLYIYQSGAWYPISSYIPPTPSPIIPPLVLNAYSTNQQTCGSTATVNLGPAFTINISSTTFTLNPSVGVWSCTYTGLYHIRFNSVTHNTGAAGAGEIVYQITQNGSVINQNVNGTPYPQSGGNTNYQSMIVDVYAQCNYGDTIVGVLTNLAIGQTITMDATATQVSFELIL